MELSLLLQTTDHIVPLMGLCDELFAVRVITPYRLYGIITLTAPLDDKDHKTVFSPV